MSYELNRDSEELKAQGNTLFDKTFRDSSGNIVIAQPPNLPLLVALTATLLQFVLPSGNLQAGFDLVGFGAWFTWAWLELFQGVNYFRQALGLVVLVAIIAFRLNIV